MLRRDPETAGETYQLANPEPPTIERVIDLVAAALERRVVRHGVPKWGLKGALDHVPGLSSLTGVQPGLIDYFDLPTRYDARKTVAALDGSGVRCPRFEDYVDALVGYLRDQPDPPTGAMC